MFCCRTKIPNKIHIYQSEVPQPQNQNVWSLHLSEVILFYVLERKETKSKGRCKGINRHRFTGGYAENEMLEFRKKKKKNLFLKILGLDTPISRNLKHPTYPQNTGPRNENNVMSA